MRTLLMIGAYRLCESITLHIKEISLLFELLKKDTNNPNKKQEIYQYILMHEQSMLQIVDLYYHHDQDKQRVIQSNLYIQLLKYWLLYQVNRKYMFDNIKSMMKFINWMYVLNN